MSSLFARTKPVLALLGRVEKVFVVLLAVWAILYLLMPDASSRLVLTLALYFLGAWVAIRLLRRGIKKAIWRLRNRLLVAYAFIAVVPIVLILLLAGMGAWMITSKVAGFLVTAELNRRTQSLQRTAAWMARQAQDRPDTLRQMAPYIGERYPDVQMVIRHRNELRFPADATVTPPPQGWKSTGGLLLKDGRLFQWGHAAAEGGEVTILAPLPTDYLSQLVPNLGAVSYVGTLDHRDLSSRPSGLQATEEGGAPKRTAVKFNRTGGGASGTGSESASRFLPPPVNRFDFEVFAASVLPAAIWENPNQSRYVVIAISSRPSAVFNAVTLQNAEWDPQNLLPSIFLGLAVAFLIVELISLIFGVSLTRTITAAVHNLYQGTHRVMRGDFSHRIEVKGNDQLAELGRSFNQMTENLERLVAVAKEKERLQSEIEIAREVQNQLYPKSAPALKNLRVTAICKPARMVSGDYYDYQSLDDAMVALAIGDVAGKGISAALLMATLQASLRSLLRTCIERAAAVGSVAAQESTSVSRLVSRMNQQLYADTSPEKYATFYLSIYNQITGVLTYCNAGHLPPILVRKGVASMLGVNGMVVGAFPFSEYDESRITLEPGDLLVCYTDGITEPENEFGEMFGEERLIDLLIRNAHRDGEEIVAAIIDSVKQWTGAPAELQDDMTLLVARRDP